MKKIFSLLAAVLFAGSMMAAEAILQYTGGVTANMDGDGANNAATLGLDATLFSVTAEKGAASNFPGLNKANDIRLYAHSASGNGNIITVTIANGTITSIVLDIKQTATFVVKAGETAVTEAGGAYAINATSFSIQNTTSGESTQLQLNKITITYTAGEGGEPAVEPGDEPSVLQAVSDSTTWDFSKITANTTNALYGNEGIHLTDESTPSKNDEVIYADYSEDFMTIGEDFNKAAIAFKGEYPIRKNQYCQAGTLHFKAAVAGSIVVKFSDTGTSASATAVKRYLVVNGEQTEYWTSRENNGETPYDAQLNVVSGKIEVPAGDVTITGSSAITMYYVTFVPAPAPVLPDVLNVAEAIAAATATPAQIANDDSIAVRGVVNKIEFKGKNFATYGSVTIYATDATGAEGTFTFYNCYSLEADTFKTSNPAFDAANTSNAFFNSVTDGNGVSVWVGDTVVAEGKYNYYTKNAAHQLNQGCYLTEIIAGPRVEPAAGVDPEPIEGAITVAKAIELVNAMEDGATSTHEFTVEGYVVNAAEFSWSSLSQLFFLADNAENSGNQVFEAYYCTGMENGQAIPLINGDKVQLTGHLQKFVKGTDMTPEISNAPAEIIEKAEGERPAQPTVQEITVAQALTIGAGVEHNKLTAEYYSITGYITKFVDLSKDNSFWMADAADGGSDKTTAFEVYKPVFEGNIQVGDKVNVITRIKNYSQTIESETSATVTVVEALKIDTVNVATAVNLALQLDDNTASTKDYVVIGNVAKIATAYSDQFHNISFFMTDDAVSADAEGALKVFQGGIDEAAGKALAPGDRVMVVGKLFNNFYKDANSAQIAKNSKVTVLWKQAIEQIVLTEKVNKVIMDGVIYIVRDGKLYNLQGAQVR